MSVLGATSIDVKLQIEALAQTQNGFQKVTLQNLMAFNILTAS